jgi:hypothetical protein
VKKPSATACSSEGEDGHTTVFVCSSCTWTLQGSDSGRQHPGCECVVPQVEPVPICGTCSNAASRAFPLRAEACLLSFLALQCAWRVQHATKSVVAVDIQCAFITVSGVLDAAVIGNFRAKMDMANFCLFSGIARFAVFLKSPAPCGL